MCIPGSVSSVLANNDGTKTVIIKHGGYFTIYSNLGNVSVSKGQQVSSGTPVGVLLKILTVLTPLISRYGAEVPQLIH